MWFAQAWSRDRPAIADGRCPLLQWGLPPSEGWQLVDCRVWSNIVAGREPRGVRLHPGAVWLALTPRWRSGAGDDPSMIRSAYLTYIAPGGLRARARARRRDRARRPATTPNTPAARAAALGACPGGACPVLRHGARTTRPRLPSGSPSLVLCRTQNATRPRAYFQCIGNHAPAQAGGAQCIWKFT